ncbi:MAG: MlaD family protein [Elusimicrobiota bacterium]|jgi:phospholipid/cholesterol/gamma-HCH transport system substrate-binding protein|nr:MlaD family protein [Elusimicrobiota bacterium]
MSNLAKVGLFTAFGLAAILGSIVAVGNWTFSRGYDVYVVFDNAAGLSMKAKVKIAGVDIGMLENITLKNKQARLQLKINKDVILYQNAVVKIVSTGIIGTKYLDIDPGDDSFPRLKDGDELQGMPEMSLEAIIEKMSASFNSNEYGNMFDNLAASVKDLNMVMNNVANQNAKITDIIDNFDKFSKNLVTLTAKLDIIIDKIDQGSGTISVLLNDEKMAEDLKETIADAKQTVSGLRDTIGTTGQLRFEWDYLGRYNTRQAIFKNDVGITISPTPDKFYYVGVANLANSSSGDDDDPTYAINRLEAMLGFRFNKVEIYGGIMRGEGGIGIGYSVFEPMYAPYKLLQFHVAVYDMGRKVENEQTSRPIVDTDLRVGLLSWLYTGVMIEDAAYKAGITTYIRIKLDDRDIARMLGIVGIAAQAAK